MLERFWDSLWSSGLSEGHTGIRLFQFAVQAIQHPIDPAGRDSGDSAAPVIDRPFATMFVNVPDFLQTLVDLGASSVLGAGTSEAPADAASIETLARSGLVSFGGGASMIPGSPVQIVADAASIFVVLYDEDLQSGLVVNMVNKTLLEGGPGNFPELSSGPNDILALTGDFSVGFALPVQPQDIDTVVLGHGNDYNLSVSDENVGLGQTMTIDGMKLGADNHVIFDGGAEKDGSFLFLGSQTSDTFIGGGGDDRILGLGGADTLAGGGGADTFIYTGSDQSTGNNYDTLAGFDPSVDRIDLLGGVASWGTAVSSGALSHASFGADLGTAMAGLGAAQATWFTPDKGDLAGTIFLVVDANGVAGYQEGEDYVFAFTGTPLPDLTGHTDIFV